MNSDTYSPDALISHINEQEAFLAEENKKIYLVILSAYYWEVLKSECENITTIAVASEGYPETINGYEIKVIDDMGYTEPVHLVTGIKSYFNRY